MSGNNVVITRDACGELSAAIDGISPDRVFALYDGNTRRLCSPLLADCGGLRGAAEMTIPPADANKTIETLSAVWVGLCDGGASRRSLLVCVGGGMVTDLGGFAAATFKRGIAYVNVPTTLLGMVDASVGGKTAVNFKGLKNEIGAFHTPAKVIIDTRFLSTLDAGNLLSGYAEMIKHGLISGPALWTDVLNFDISRDGRRGALRRMVAESVRVKAEIAASDPEERGLRKVLNVGHTAGHALESLALAKGRLVLHGYAVAWGIVAELYLSLVKKGFPSKEMNQTAAYIREHYGACRFSCDDYEELYRLMTHDKKNAGETVNFTLLSGIGRPELDCAASKDEIFAMLDFLRDALG